MKSVFQTKTATFLLAAAFVFTVGCTPTLQRPHEVAQSAHRARLEWVFGDPWLQIDLPKGFTMSRQHGPDFFVFWYTNTKTDNGITVYWGNQTSLSAEAKAVGKNAREAVTIDGVPGEWRLWKNKRAYWAETILSKDAFWLWHIHIHAPTNQERRRLQEALKTLKLELID